jgi:hypothetical protein
MTTTTTYLSASIQLADPIPSLSPSHADRVTTALPRRIDSSGDDLESPCGFGCPKLLVGDAPLPQVRRVEHAAGRCGLQIRTTSPAAITSSLVPSSYHTGDTSSPAATAHARCASGEAPGRAAWACARVTPRSSTLEKWACRGATWSPAVSFSATRACTCSSTTTAG